MSTQRDFIHSKLTEKIDGWYNYHIEEEYLNEDNGPDLLHHLHDSKEKIIDDLAAIHRSNVLYDRPIFHAMLRAISKYLDEHPDEYPDDLLTEEQRIVARRPTRENGIIDHYLCRKGGGEHLLTQDVYADEEEILRVVNSLTKEEYNARVGTPFDL